MQIVLKRSAIRSDAFHFLQIESSKMTGKIVARLASCHFDLFLPPCELLLLKCGDWDLIILRLHHALYDALTIPILLRDLEAFYKGDNPNTIDPETSSTTQCLMQSSKSLNSQAY